MPARHAAYLLQREPIGSIDPTVMTALKIAPATYGHNVPADADATSAENAPSAKMSHVRMSAGFAHNRGAPSPGNHVHEVLVRVVLQTAVTRGLANRAIQGVVGQQQFQYEFAQLEDLLAVRLDAHAFPDRCGAGSHRPPSSLHLHQTHAAGPVGLKARIMAKRGYIDACGTRHLQDGLAGERPYLLPVQGECDRLCSGRRGVGCHSRSSLAVHGSVLCRSELL